MSTRLHLDEADRAHLRERATEIGVALDPTAVDRFARYADLLGMWSERMSLISCDNSRELVDRHFLDALVLAACPLVADAEVLIDLGSGAGLPGIPLAIAWPEKRVILVEPRHRRATFLREVRRRITITNVDVLIRRAELTSGPVEVEGNVVLSRAVWSNEDILQVAAPWLVEGGTLLWVRGADARAPAITGAGPLAWRASRTYEVTDSHRGRIEVYQRG